MVLFALFDIIMRRNKQQASFLNIGSTPVYFFQKVQSYTLADHIKEYNEKLLTGNFLKHHVKDM